MVSDLVACNLLGENSFLWFVFHLQSLRYLRNVCSYRRKVLASTWTETSNLISCLTVHKIHKYSFSKSRMFMQSAFCQGQISLCEASRPEGNSSYRSRTPACHDDLSSTSFFNVPFQVSFNFILIRTLLLKP